MDNSNTNRLYPRSRMLTLKGEHGTPAAQVLTLNATKLQAVRSPLR